VADWIVPTFPTKLQKFVDSWMTLSCKITMKWECWFAFSSKTAIRQWAAASFAALKIIEGSVCDCNRIPYQVRKRLPQKWERNRRFNLGRKNQKCWIVFK
jgi:hypothetical protein